MTPAEGWGLLWRPLKSHITQHIASLHAHSRAESRDTSAMPSQLHKHEDPTTHSTSVFLCTPMGLLKVVDVVDFLNSTVALCHLPTSACAARLRNFVLTILHSEWNLPSRIQNLACNCVIEMRHSFVLDWHVVTPLPCPNLSGSLQLLDCYFAVMSLLCSQQNFMQKRHFSLDIQMW